MPGRRVVAVLAWLLAVLAVVALTVMFWLGYLAIFTDGERGEEYGDASMLTMFAVIFLGGAAALAFLKGSQS